MPKTFCKLKEQTKEKKTKVIKRKKQQDYFKLHEFEQFNLKGKNNYIRKCNKCKQNFDGENYVIAVDLMVPYSSEGYKTTRWTLN